MFDPRCLLWRPAALLLLVLVCACRTIPASAFQDNVPNQLIIGWTEPIPAAVPGATRRPLGPPHPLRTSAIGLIAAFDLDLRAVLMDGNAWLVEARSALQEGELEAIASKIDDEQLTRYVAPNHIVRFAQSGSGPVNDPKYSQQDNLHLIDVEGAWAHSTGSPEIVVAVLDTGVKVDHPDLVGSLWQNPCEKLNGTDDPCAGSSHGNGYADDVHGWNFGTPVTGDANLADAGLHGTAVAGVIAATRHNAEGIAGIGDLGIAVIKTTNHTLSDVGAVIQGLDYAREQGFRIVNASFTTDYNLALEQAIQLAGAANMIVVAAAGDDFKDLDVASNNVYPASFDFDWVISVAGTDPSDVLKSDSNHGNSVIEIAAPGVQVLSTFAFPGLEYTRKSGSSMAAPHVSGVIGLILSARPTATVGEIRACLSNGDPTDPNKTVWGVRLNARKAVEACVFEAPPRTPGRPALLVE